MDPTAAIALPPRPNLEQYRKLSKELVKACKSDHHDALRAWAAHWIETLVGLQGLANTPQLRARIDHEASQVERFARRKLTDPDQAKANCALADAQFVIARAHGFESWPRLAKHIEALARATSPISRFETAVDAIIHGDIGTLQSLLRENPELIRARSTRSHHATLLHYVSANGVEGYRQETPKNAVEVANALLQAGAEVDAVAECYGGASTTLGLVATSIHPARAGVQVALMELLMDAGAHVDGAPGGWPIVNAALANGRPEAAEMLARRGARLDIEGASGLGRLDLLESFFHEDGSLKANATRKQMESGFMWACEYGRTSVVDFLLQRGLDVATQDRNGQTGLHWAVIGGKLDTIKLLLQRKAPLEVRNGYGGTVLGQAVWSTIHSDPVWRWPNSETDWASIVETLIAAGAKVESARYPTGNERIDEVLQRHGATETATQRRRVE